METIFTRLMDTIIIELEQLLKPLVKDIVIFNVNEP